MRILLYARTETNTLKDRKSVDRQLDQCKLFVMKKIKDDEVGWKRWSKSYVDRGVSGLLPFDERKKGMEVYQAVMSGDMIVVASLDHMWLTASDCYATIMKLRRKGVKVWSLDIGEEITRSKMFHTIIKTFASKETMKEKIRARVVKEKHRSQQDYLGGKVPFGYRLDTKTKKLIEVPKQQRTIDELILKRNDKSKPVQQRSYTFLATIVRKRHPELLQSHARTIKRILDRETTKERLRKVRSLQEAESFLGENPRRR